MPPVTKSQFNTSYSDFPDQKWPFLRIQMDESQHEKMGHVADCTDSFLNPGARLQNLQVAAAEMSLARKCVLFLKNG